MVNLTPHPVTVRLPDGTEHTYPPSGFVARVDTVEYKAEPIDGLPTIARTMGRVSLGYDALGQTLIVSSLVLQAALAQKHPDLSRLVAPDTGPTAIRDERGQVRAVTRWVVA